MGARGVLRSCLVALTGIVVVLAGLAWADVPARAASRPGAAKAVWMSAQEVVTGASGATTTLTIKWPRVRGATSYDLIHAPSTDVFGSRHRRLRTGIARSGTPTETYVLRGLVPGRKYCFRVRGRSSGGVGTKSPLHCKITMPASRALNPAKVPMKITTFNVCGNADACQRWSWTTRRPLVRQHVLMSGADVVAVQEGRRRLPDIEADLASAGFVKACAASGAQAVFVRRSVYAVSAGSAGGVRFTSDPAHGGCWARVRHLSTGNLAVVSSVHLYVGRTAYATRARDAQTAKVLTMMEARYGVVNAPGTPPFVLIGDFNSHRGHPVDAPLLRLTKAGFHDAYDVSATYRAPYLNSANGYRSLPVRSVLWGAHVDRVFIPKGASVTGWRTVSRISKGRYVTPMPSDHHPVAVTAYLPPVGGCVLVILCG